MPDGLDGLGWEGHDEPEEGVFCVGPKGKIAIAKTKAGNWHRRDDG